MKSQLRGFKRGRNVLRVLEFEKESPSRRYPQRFELPVLRSLAPRQDFAQAMQLKVFNDFVNEGEEVSAPLITKLTMHSSTPLSTKQNEKSPLLRPSQIQRNQLIEKLKWVSQNHLQDTYLRRSILIDEALLLIEKRVTHLESARMSRKNKNIQKKLLQIERFKQVQKTTLLSSLPTKNVISPKILAAITRLKKNLSMPSTQMSNLHLRLLPSVNEIPHSAYTTSSISSSALNSRLSLLSNTLLDLSNYWKLPISNIIPTLQLLRDDFEEVSEATIGREKLSLDEIELVMEELDFPKEDVERTLIECQRIFRSVAKEENTFRPPVVAVMGHVNHGKTTLLDALRGTNVAQNESGRITQRLSAFQVVTPHTKNRITFIDTPGHDVFSSMRQVSTSIADIIVLIVAANDRVNAQTVEVIQKAKSEKLPIIVAINKVDKENTDINRIYQELSEHGVVCEAIGGDTQAVPISALKKTNLDTLEEEIIALAELLELGAKRTSEEKDNNKSIKGKIISESKVVNVRYDSALGRVYTVIVREGQLQRKQYVKIGGFNGKIRGIYSIEGERLEVGEVSMPVDVVLDMKKGGREGKGEENDMVGFESAKDLETYVKEMERKEERLEVGTEASQDVDESVMRMVRRLAMKGESSLNGVSSTKLRRLVTQYIEQKKREAKGKEANKSEEDCRVNSLADVLDDGEGGEELSVIKEQLSPVTVPPGHKPQVNLLIRTRLQAELEPILSFIQNFNTQNKNNLEEDPFSVISASASSVTAADSNKIGPINGVVLCFNADCESETVEGSLVKQGIALRKHEVIFDIFKDIQDLYSTHFSSRCEVTKDGSGSVKRIGQYTLSKSKGGVRTVIGVKCTHGSLHSQQLLQVIRNKVPLTDQYLRVQSMQKSSGGGNKDKTEGGNKESVSTLKKGEEGSIIFRKFDNVQEGDEIVSFNVSERVPLWGSKNLYFSKIDI